MNSEPDSNRPKVRFRKGVSAPERRCRRRARARLADTESDPIVVDDLPDIVPVGTREIDVIETYLGHLLNALLAAKTEA
jgi:hypothetical protein